MNQVFIPSHLQHLTGGQDSVAVEGKNIRQVIRALDNTHPGLAARLVDGDRLKPGVAVAIDGAVDHLGLYATLERDSEIFFVLAIEGG